MKSFKEIAILEALRIVKRASDKNQPQLDKRQDILGKIHNSEIEDNKPVKNQIGDIDGFPVVKSKHVGMIRDGEQNPRDEGLRDAIIIRTLKKAIKKGFSRKTGKTLITYKNKKSKKYDMIVASWESNAIVIITVIQDSKDNPKQYFTPKHQKAGDKMITTESFNILSIEDIIIL